MCAVARKGEGWMARRMATGEARGFSYLMLLGWVAVGGVMLSALGRQWLIEGRREQEAEWRFRGQQISQALAHYAAATPVGQPTAPDRWQDLLDDRRSGRTLRHLRALMPDPITRGPWAEVREQGRLVGVYSPSEAVPLKAMDDAARYRDRVFMAQGPDVAVPVTAPVAAPIKVPAPAPDPAGGTRNR